MSEKRFEVDVDHLLLVWDTEKNKRLEIEDIVALLNEQQDQISYWKHKVSSLLWILGQFDKAKVKELLKELDDE